MNIEEFDYHLPEELIAQFPLEGRSDSKLLVLDPVLMEKKDKQFNDFLSYLSPEDLLIFNNTKVINARIYGNKPTGGKVEILIEKIIDDHTVLTHIGTSKKIDIGLKILVGKENIFEVLERVGKLFILKVSHNIDDVITNHGHLPLPPYITRSDNDQDNDRYQTVFASQMGAIAAPTAGLHFDDKFFPQLRKKNINHAFITLHVGSGTFQPVRENIIENHSMHSEDFIVPLEVFDQIKETKARGGRVIAIGTTALRALESAFQSGAQNPNFQKTDIFIYPGYKFKVIDALFTNFHLPKSTLLMLVSAFGGHKFMMEAYLHAINKKYRFFSYGDAMFIERNFKQTDK